MTPEHKCKHFRWYIGHLQYLQTHRKMSSKNYKIACIPADGIGPEVIDAGVKVLEALSAASKSFTLDFEHYDWSSETYKKTGKYIPDNGLEELKKHDAIFFGAVGAPGTFCASQGWKIH